MNKKAQEDKVFGFMSFEKVPWSPDGQCIFFFCHPKSLRTCPYYFLALMSWLQQEEEGCGRDTEGKRSRKRKCLHDLHIDGASLVRERSGHLPIMMSALLYLMEMVQYLPHQKLICPRDIRAQHSKNETPTGASFWSYIQSH